MITHRGGCHCGRVRFEFDAEADLNVSECNCSICAKSGFRGIAVPRARFRLLSGEDALSTYTFNTGVAKHTFCVTCGVKSFYYPRSHPDGVNVNARCVDPETVRRMTVRPFDGQAWEQQYPKGRAEGFAN